MEIVDVMKNTNIKNTRYRSPLGAIGLFCALILIAILIGPTCTQAQELTQTIEMLGALKLMNEGNALVEQKKPKSIHEGIKKYSEAAEIFRKHRMQQGEASVLVAMGMAYSTLGELDNSLKYLNQAIPWPSRSTSP
jgi:hypothetical protein